MTTSPRTSDARDPAAGLGAGVRVAALYETHGRTVLGLCRFLLRDASEAEDATQQAFLSAYRSLLGGAVPREPAAWLAAIARNECWGRIKRRMREPLTLHEVPSELPDPLELAAQNADLEALRDGLATLSRPQRQAFLLREFAGLSYGELATALGVTEPAVDSLLFRARTRLRRALGAANGLLLPVALRDQLAQLIPGFDQPATGTLAKLVSLPIAAKLAVAGAGAVLVVAGSTGVGRHAPARAHTAAPARVRAVQRAVTSALPPSRSTPRMLWLPGSSEVASAASTSSTKRAARGRGASTAQASASRRESGEAAPASAPGGRDDGSSDSGTVPSSPRTDDGGSGTPTVGDGALPTEGAPRVVESSDGGGGPLSLLEAEPSSDGSGSGSSSTSGSSGSSGGTDATEQPVPGGDAVSSDGSGGGGH